MNEFDRSPEEIREKIANMTWSFSRISSFHQCAYEWYLKYIADSEKENNYYGALGGFGHKVLEKFFKGELDIFDAAPYWEEHYVEEVPYDAPPNKYVDLKEKDYNLIDEYFQNLDFDFDRYEILGVEEEVHFKVGDYNCIGYIDLRVRDKQTDEMIIIDHKSSSFKYLKNGGVAKGNQEQFEKYKKQLYLYSIPVKEKYGVYPNKLKWNMFKDHKWIEIDFKEEELEETKKWAIAQIHQIEEELLWLPNDSNDWYCRYLCSANGCPYRK